MKTITFLFITFMTLTSLNAQVSNTNEENSITDNSNALGVSVDTDSLTENEAYLYPNPVGIGENVQIKNINQGEEISVFEPNGTFVSNQYVDLDKQIYTNDLTAGKYIIRTDSAYLKLVVK